MGAASKIFAFSAVLLLPSLPAFAVTYNCSCEAGANVNSDATGVYCLVAATGARQDCTYYARPNATNAIEACVCLDDTWIATDTGNGVVCVDSSSGSFRSCEVTSAAPMAQGWATSSASETATSTAEQLEELTRQKVLDEIKAQSENSDGKQSDSLTDANRVLELGANRSATVGAVFCAEGANAAVSDPLLSSNDFAACRDNFSAANAMNAKSGRAGYLLDTAISGSDGAKSTMSEFEKNFGITGGDYFSRMFGARGARSELEDMLGGKIADAKLKDALDGADQIKPSSEASSEISFGAPAAGSRKPAAVSVSLRDKLKKKLLEVPQAVPSRDPEKAAHDESSFGQLASGAREEFFPATEDNGELTIFDVVHRRYEILSESRGLIRFLKRR